MIDRRAPVLLALLVLAAPSLAEEPRGCDAFSWNLDRERQALGAPGIARIASGGAGLLGSAFLLQLRPLADGVLKQVPERAPTAAGRSAGYVAFAAPQAGAYQVTLSAAAGSIFCRMANT